MLKIGEFSKLTNISVRMLHYYDEVGLLKPIQTDSFTGYRFYSVSQIPTLQKIIMLRDLHFQISEIQSALNDWSKETLIQKMKLKIKEKEEIIKQEQQQIKQIERTIESIDNEQLHIHYNVILREIPEQRVVSLRHVIPHYHDEGILWSQLLSYIKSEHIEILKQNNNNIAIYHDQEHKEKGVDIEVCFLVKNKMNCSKPYQCHIIKGVETMACMMVRGSYHHLSLAYQSFAQWLDDNPQYEMDGLSRQICHRDYTNEENEDDFLTEIQIPVQMIEN